MSEFRLPEKRATITLDDAEYAGAEISVSLRMPMAVLRELSEFASTSRDADALGRIDRVRDLFIEWARPAWNLTDADGPIPATREGMERLLPGEIGMIVGAWIRGVVDPPAPLPQPSSGPTQFQGSRRRQNSSKRAC